MFSMNLESLIFHFISV